MPGGSKKPETVRVISDFSYKPDNSSEKISLKVGDEYQLVKKVNDDWWYVKRSESSLPSFYIPARYVEVVQKGPSDVETGGKSPVIGGGGGGRSPNVATSGKSLEPTSPAVTSPTARVLPKPKPRISKSASEDEALKVLDAAIDEGEVREAKSDEAAKSNKLPSVSEIRLDKKAVETPPDKEKIKVGESAKAPSVESAVKSPVHPTLPKVGESAMAASVESAVKSPVHPTLPKVGESSTVKLPVHPTLPKVGESAKAPSIESTVKSPVHPTLPKVSESAKSPSVESAVKSPVHPTLPNLPCLAASSGLPASTGLPTPPGLSTPPGPSSSSVPSTLTPPISSTDEINYVNLEQYQQMVRDRLSQTTVLTDNLIDSETTDMTTVASDNPAESETSDYRSGDSKGGSRESLDSDSQGKSNDTDSIGKEEPEKAVQVATPLPVPNVEDLVIKTKAELVLQPKPAVSKVPRGANSGTSEYANIEDIRKAINAHNGKPAVATDGKTPVGGPPAIEVPSGWKVEVEDGVSTFVNSTTGEKWTSVVDKEGRNYFYNLSTHATVWNLADVPTSASSSVQRRVPSSGTSTSSSAKVKDRRTLAASSELDKNQGAWARKAGLLRLAFSGKGGKMLEGAIAEADPSLSEAAAEFPALEPLPIKMVQKQGQLGKAKVDQGKKAKKPSWSQSYAVLLENGLYFYKDQKVSAGAKPKSVNSLGKPELILDLVDAQVSSSPDEKKNQILVLTLSKGDVYLLHNESEDVLQHWRESLENNITVLVTTPSKDVKDLSITTPTKPVEMSRMSSYISVLGDDRMRIADKLLHWLKRRPTKETLQAKGILKDAVFGSSLTELCEREKTKIPRFVHECIVAVEKRGLDVEGVYRVGGNMANVQRLRQIVDNNEYYDLNSSFWDIHVVTGALKLFFRELSEPLFTFALFEEFLDAYKAQGRTRQVKAIRDIVRKLPTIHKETMKELFKHLTDVIRHTTSNRMNTQALAIVFGPTLLWPEAKSKDVTLAASMVYQGQVVEFMIIEFKAIFS